MMFFACDEIRKFSQIPIVFYTYYNLYFPRSGRICGEIQGGWSGWFDDAGFTSEEAGELLVACEKQDMANVFIIAPTTPKKESSRLQARRRVSFIMSPQKCGRIWLEI